MTDTKDASPLSIALRYLQALENFAPSDELSDFFTEDVVQEEYPNRLVPQGARRERADLLKSSERGRTVLSNQRFEVVHTVAQDDTVVLEVRWTGTLAIPVGGMPAGSEMRAKFAVVLEFRDGRIARQRNYDCFDPW